jgi:hypothetical protein
MADKQIGIKKITKISTIIDVLNVQPIGKIMFYKSNRLLRLYLRMPVTTDTTERSFSAMNRMKTCLRSTMTQTHLDSIFLRHIYTKKRQILLICHVFVRLLHQRRNREKYFLVFCNHFCVMLTAPISTEVQ